MAHDLTALLGPDGVMRTASLATLVDRHTIDGWVTTGRLIRPHRAVVVLPAQVNEWRTRAIAAVLATRGTLSHSSALTIWRRAPQLDRLHVSIPTRRRALAGPGVTVHRVQRLLTDRLGAYPVTPLDRGLVDTWAWAHGRPVRRHLVEVARAAVINSVRERQVTVTEVRAEIARQPTLAGRRELDDLLRLIASGCQSELEIWGVQHVLRGAGMPRFLQQHRVVLPHAVVHLDSANPELKIAVELDGAAFHGSAQAREDDTRRDVALAALGWVVLRFSYRRLTSDPKGCRQEIIAVCDARRSLLLRK